MAVQWLHKDAVHTVLQTPLAKLPNLGFIPPRLTPTQQTVHFKTLLWQLCDLNELQNIERVGSDSPMAEAGEGGCSPAAAIPNMGTNPPCQEALAKGSSEVNHVPRAAHGGALLPAAGFYSRRQEKEGECWGPGCCCHGLIKGALCLFKPDGHIQLLAMGASGCS